MRKFTLLLAACLFGGWHHAGAVTIGADQSVGQVPMDPGTGLLGSYYKLNTTFVTSMTQATQFISTSGGPTATFTTTDGFVVSLVRRPRPSAGPGIRSCAIFGPN